VTKKKRHVWTRTKKKRTIRSSNCSLGWSGHETPVEKIERHWGAQKTAVYFKWQRPKKGIKGKKKMGRESRKRKTVGTGERKNNLSNKRRQSCSSMMSV